MTNLLEQDKKKDKFVDFPSDLSKYDFIWEEELRRQEIQRRQWKRRHIIDRPKESE